MSKLQELIRELCPEGVEYKRLGDICKILRGKRLTTRDLVPDGKFPVFHGGIEPIGYYSTNNRIAHSVMLINVGASAGTVGFCDRDFWSSDGCFCFTHNENINQKFLFFVLQSMESAIKSKVRKAGIPTLDNKEIERIMIPVPPLPVQEEIVSILDHFTNLAAELQTELQARKEQYEYYKQTIFKSVSIHYKDFLLKEIATFSQGIQVDPNLQYDTMESGRIRFLRIVDFVSDNEPYRYIETPSDKYIKSENELIMIRYGASAAGKVFMCYSGAIANNMFKINLKPEILPKYVMYYLSQNSIYRLLNSSGGKSTMPAINFKLVGSIHIPIPPYSEQQRIVSILDKFETLVNDLSQGLPAEIAAVQEQYEYYRNKLFSFPRKSA